MNSLRRRLSGLIVVAVGVAGCAMSSLAPPVVVPPAPMEPPAPVVVPVPEPAPEPEPEPEKPPLPDPQTLKGMTGTALTALLGPPELLRKEPPAEVWRYAGERCLLHVFLYADGPDSQYRVAYFETLDRNAAAAPAAECFAALIAPRAAK